MALKLEVKKEGMLDLQEIQIIAQLVENMLIASENLENSYNKRSGEEFIKAGKELLNTQKKITDILS